MYILKKHCIDSAENIEYLDRMRRELFSFGTGFPSPGGSSYYLGDDGTPWKERSRETWITARMAHVYSLASLLGVEGSEALADAALKGLTEELQDREHDGWYAGLTQDNEILPDKQCYAHAFVILAACSCLLAKRPGAEDLLKKALAVYDRYFWNEEEGLSCDTWNTEFSQCSDYRGLNANMHTVEAFLAVADTLGDETYRIRAGRIISRVLVWAEENNWRIPEHFSSDWTPDLECNKERPDDPFKPYGATPGHGIEWARLILQWALSTWKDQPDQALPYILAAENLYNRAISDAWERDGAPGICYTTDWEGNPVVHDRMHWTLCEAINTSACLYRTTNRNQYAENYAEFMVYLDESVQDHEHGSWFHQLDQNNQLLTTVWPGKSDLYHAVQATLIPYYPVDTSIAAALKK
ncbi:MAG: AGE family epimerase/isomerase [Lachnospiraceae bacterium]|nr:AGE family epimerase/isomerase [Lachnospiraceae bacterium]